MNYLPCGHYSGDAFKAKEEFVEKALLQFQPKTVLDIGCNKGHFSRLAAKRGGGSDCH